MGASCATVLTGGILYGDVPVRTIANEPATAPFREVGRCPFCGGRAEPSLEAVDRNRELSDERFRYRRCLGCGTLSLIDVPADLGRFYPPSYYELPAAGDLERLAPAEAHKVSLVRRYVPPGRMVEVGPGAGVFAYGAARAGFDVTAIEMDPRTCEHLSTAVGVRVIESDDPAAGLAGLPASRAIAMWHVLEHLPDPAAAIDAASENLEPGGVLALATPNPQALQFRLLKARWAHVDAPRHLFLIPLEALTRRAAAAGLRRAEVTTSDPSGRHWNRFGWESAMRRRPSAGPAPKPVAVVALGLTLAVRPLEHTALRGAAYTAVFIKDAA
jgi:2-polyprenyl-3-methyl-5-hydroxy-6-metoxy-1,4-benzoquinol methylase